MTHAHKIEDQVLAAVRFNPHVEALPPYNAGMNIAVARVRSGRDDIAALASNENPYGCSPAVMRALASPGFQPWRYSDPSCTELRAALAAAIGVNSDRIVVGNGSEEMIAAISRAVLVPGDRVVTVAPSFGLHEIEPLAAGAKVQKVAMTAGLEFDVAALEIALGSGQRLAFLSSPSNPVGCALDHDGLKRIIAAAGPGTLLVLDEAYHEFAGPDVPNGLDYLRASSVPYVVLRTFSKAYGLAGLRVGYAVCSSAEIARVVGAAKTPFNVNAAAQAAAMAALADKEWMQVAVAKIARERNRVVEALRSMGLEPARSEANFVFLDCRQDSASVAQHLLTAGIIVKPWRETGYQTYIRATIGLPEENDRLLASLTELQAPK